MAEPPRPHWDRLKDLFSEAVALAPALRASWIGDACGPDATLRRELQALLEAHDQAGDFLDTPAFATPAAALAIVSATAPPARDRPAPQRCGAYRIVRELGRGGMGTVYLGSRDDDRFEKAVAIKIVSDEFAHPVLVERFEDERRILASLDHPNIARLIDAGTTDAGVPFVVMEYVEGQPIDVYCSARQLPVRDRLVLFGLVCAAVQYSHQHLVVHRDIKARNILVTAAGAPTLLDFGIAKLIQAEGIGGDVTRTGLRALTPESASPEQVRGEPVTVATDVYSLGVLLYRLLADRSPYRGAMKTESDIARAICDEEPVRPSEAIASSKQRSREVRGDLDLIVLKALHKDKGRRYGTVEQLSDDLTRHLSGRPVLARSDSMGYRAAKFARRHRIGVSLSALTAVLLVAGIITTAREARIAQQQRIRAESRFNDVRRLANSFLFEFHDAIQDLPGLTKARELVVRRATQYLDSLSNESANDASLQRELAASYEKVGDVQGLPNFANLGDTAGALTSHRRALALRQGLAAANPEDAVTQRELAVTYHHLSAISSSLSDPQAALENERKSVAIHEALLAKDPGAGGERRSMAIAYQRLGEIMSGLGNRSAALDNFRRESETFDAILSENPAKAGAQRDAALADKMLGAVLEQAGDRPAALAMYRKAIALDDVRARASVNDNQAYLDLSFSYASLAHLIGMGGDTEGALDNYQKALAWREQVAAADPRDMNALNSVARAHLSIGDVLQRAGRTTEAIQRFNKALSITAARFATDPSNGSVGEQLAAIYADLAISTIALASAAGDKVGPLGRWREARSLSQKGIDVVAPWRAKGTISERGKGQQAELVQLLAKCDLALTKF